MKHFILIMLVALSTAVMAQRGERGKFQANGKVVDASAVPEAVKNTQAQNFPGTTVNRWELHSSSNAKKSFQKYVAIYMQDGLRARARYKEDGTALSSSKYFNAEKAPEVVKTAATRYSGYTLNAGEEVKTFAKGKTFYRVRFRKGGQRMVVLLDEAGNEVTKDKAPEEALEDEGESGNN